MARDRDAIPAPARGREWAVVLAAGDGRRLREWMRRATGETAPKQFCSFRGSDSLLAKALARAERFAPRERTLVVVAEKHRTWWEPALKELPARNVVVQPGNRGTAAGILLPLWHVLGRDPEATVTFLPSDHSLEDETMLSATLRRAAAVVSEFPERVLLLGFRTKEPDPEYGWIVPEPRHRGPSLKVRRFHEKPDRATAVALVERGAFVNGFIFAARATTLLTLFETAAPGLTRAFREIRSPGDAPFTPEGLGALYGGLPTLDFSKGVLQRVSDPLWVLPVPACGWTDLGTPERLRRHLRVNAPRPLRRSAVPAA